MKKKVKKLTKLRKIKKIRKGVNIRTKETVGSSKLEKEFALFLKRIGIDFETQYQVGYKFYDFKVKGKNILIELDGDFYHGNPEIFTEGPINKIQIDARKNDLFKDKLAKGNGFKLIRIWENDYKKKKSEVVERILKVINE